MFTKCCLLAAHCTLHKSSDQFVVLLGQHNVTGIEDEANAFDVAEIIRVKLITLHIAYK